MKFGKNVLLLVIVIACFNFASDKNFALARYSINSGQACSSRGQIRDFQGQRFICRRVNAKAGSSSGPYLIWFKIGNSKSATASTSTTIKATCATGGECRVGDTGPGGGIVFYVSATPQFWGRYMEAAPTGWNRYVKDTPQPAGCYGMSNVDANRFEIGSGQRNTEAIVSSCSELNIAARLAFDLVINGKSDWFLPSRDELNAMYPHRAAIGIRINDDNQPYASSTWSTATTYWGQLFTDDPRLGNKSGMQFGLVPRTIPYDYYVRPIRYGNFSS